MKRLIILTAVTAFAAGAVAGVPAPLLQSWLSSDSDDLRLYGVTGTLSSGTAVAAEFGRLRFESPRWELNPLGLLRLKLSHDLEASNHLGPVTGRVDIGPTGNLTLRDFSGIVAIDELIRSARLPLPPMDGALQVDLKQVVIADQWLKSIEGNVVARGTTWSLLRPPLLLGNYRVELTTDDERILADIADDKAQVNLKGQAQLDAEGGYQVDMRLRPASGADQRVNNLLAPLGQPEAGGWYRIKRTGKLQRGSQSG